MSDLDICVRERLNIPEDEDTVEWCKKNGLDYRRELIKAFGNNEDHKQ